MTLYRCVFRIYYNFFFEGLFCAHKGKAACLSNPKAESGISGNISPLLTHFLNRDSQPNVTFSFVSQTWFLTQQINSSKLWGVFIKSVVQHHGSN